MKIRKELWFGFSLMAIILVVVAFYTPWANFADGHLSRKDLGYLGLLMLALIVVAIMLGFPTAFTLMGLLALPAMLRAGYSVQLAAGAITAGGCLGILIPPSVLLIVYGATAGVSVVKLYAGAFFPGIMLAGLYVGYVIIVAKWKPHLAPPLPESERIVPLPPVAASLAVRNRNAIAGLFGGLKDPSLPKPTVLGQLLIALVPAISIVALMAVMYVSVTNPLAVVDTTGLVESGGGVVAAASDDRPAGLSGVQEPPAAEGGLSEPPASGEGLKEPPAEALGSAQAPDAASIWPR